MFVDKLLALGNNLLDIAKRMGLKDWIILILVLGFASIGYAANTYYQDYLDTKSEFNKYKIEVNKEKYDEKLAQLEKDKALLEGRLKKALAESTMHEEAAKRFLAEWTKLFKNRPDKKIIKKKMEKLHGKKSLCDEFTKYNISCFTNISSQ
jgi:hypothetical protein